ncbi:hypothetical protein Tco_0643730 [Tanacetum coccineum]
MRKLGRNVLVVIKRIKIYRHQIKLSDEVESLKGQLVDAKAVAARLGDELALTNSKLSEQELVLRSLENKLVFQESETQKYKDMVAAAEQRFGHLHIDVTLFVSSDFDCLIRKLLSSDEFNATLARILSLEALSKVSNFVLGAQAKFDKAVDDFPSTSFPFLVKISEAVGNALPDVDKLQPNKLVRSATSASFPTPFSLSSKTFNRISAPKVSQTTEAATSSRARSALL